MLRLNSYCLQRTLTFLWGYSYGRCIDSLACAEIFNNSAKGGTYSAVSGLRKKEKFTLP